MAGTGMLAGLYQTPAIYVNVKGVVTNTVPIDAYRGAGRPEAAYLLERFVDHIARETGLDARRDPRRATSSSPSQMPVQDGAGRHLRLAATSRRCMRKGMEQADWKGFAARRAAVAAKGKWRGIGMATYVEKCGGGGAGDRHRQVQRRRRRSRSIIGNQTNGQGHETASRQIASARLGIDAEQHPASCRATPTSCPTA